MSNNKLESLAYRLENSDSLKRLFLELNFDGCDEPVNKENWSQNQIEIIQEVRVIACKNDYQILYVQTNTNSLKKCQDLASKIVKEKHGLCLVCTHNTDEEKWIFSSLSKEFSKSFSETRHIPIDIKGNADIPKTFVDFLNKIRVNSNSTATSIHFQISDAFDGFSLQIHDELTVNVFEAFKILNEGIILNESNNLSLDENTLEEIRENTFILLYRIIFILYAEDRGIFPTEQKIYQENFSFKWIKQEWLLKSENQKKLSEYDVQNRLWNFFKLIELGSEELGFNSNEFFMRAYYGRLFDRKINSKLNKWKIKNQYLLEVINQLTRTFDKKGNIFFLDYSALDIRHLGAIYEHLLEFHLHIEEGKIANLPDPNERKSSGSYYTPKQLVDFVVKNSIEPHISKIINESKKTEEIVEKILALKILDPSMGSGHFLVGAVDYLSKRICQIENNEDENNFIEKKREVVRHCIYGVDLNPLAVDLAKLSLWLDTIASEKPLTFLSAHLKCGDSLIGLDINEIFQKQTTVFESSIGRTKFKKSMKDFLILENLDDDTANAVRLKIERFSTMQSKNSFHYKLKFLLGTKLAQKFGYEVKPIGDFFSKVGEESLDFYSSEEQSQVKKLTDSRRFFHWELEFPEIFYDENANKKSNPGFDIIIGNPPWDVLKPSIEDFFTPYFKTKNNKSFQKLTKQEKNKFIKKLVEKNPDIQESLEKYKENIYKYSDYLQELGFYDDNDNGKIITKRETNLYKFFIKRIILLLLKNNGSCGIIIPANFYIDLNNKILRKLVFTKCNVHSLYQFDNTKKIFPAIDSRTKIISLIFSKNSSTKSFKSMFHQNDITRLEKINDEALDYDMEVIKKVSPNSLSLIEYGNEIEIEIIKKLYEFPVISKNSKLLFETKHGDFHTTKDAPLFNTKKLGVPVFQGGMIHQFTHLHNEPKYWIESKKAIKFLKSKKSKTDSKILIDAEFPRIIWRNVARGTDMRTLICTILPPKNFVTNSVNYVKPLVANEKAFSTKKLFFICGIMNSFFIDFIIRRRVDKIVGGYFLYELPLPNFNEKDQSNQDVVDLVGSLICTTQEFDDLRNELKIKKTVSSIEDRENILAKLNIIVAQIFNLTKTEIEYVLSTFPNPRNTSLKNKILNELK